MSPSRKSRAWEGVELSSLEQLPEVMVEPLFLVPLDLLWECES